MARKRAQSPVNNAESEEETAKTESQQMLAISHLLKKPESDDKEVQQFRATIGQDQKKIKAQLTQRMLQAQKEEKHRRETLVSTLRASLRPAQDTTPTYAGTHIAGNPVYTSVTSMLSASEGLVKQYQRLDDTIGELREGQYEPIADTWKQDVEDTDRQLKMGARVALRNVKKVLGADADADEDVDMESEGDGKVELSFELQRSLRYAERGVRRMVKGLPIEEGY